jgi:HEAT repeat protein
MSTRLFALLLAAALTACSSSKSSTKDDGDQSQDWRDPTNPIVQARLQARVDNIKYQRGATLISNLERIASYGPMALPVCTEGLKSDDAMTRMGCSYVLGRIGDPKAVPDLQEMLRDDVSFVRYEAASQLGNLGSRSGYSVLVKGLEDDRIEYRYKCYEALHDLTGHSFDFSHNASPERRQVSVEKWKEWLERVESEDF